MKPNKSRRTFLKTVAASTYVAGVSLQANAAQEKTIQGFDDTETTLQNDAVWRPVSERKIRVGIAGYGVCKFGAYFGFQDHPNVEVAAVTDLIPERCQGLAKACRCEKTYPSLEEMVKDDSLEAIFVATDAPSHAQHCIDALEHGKHVCTAVPAVFGSLEDADRVFEAVKRTGLKYMMFETSAYHSECYAMRALYNAGEFGKMVYSEGEYYHYMATPIDSYKGWRVGLPPQLYPTHSNAYYTCVTGGSFTEVSCMGIPSTIPHLQKENNAFGNPFGTEIALMRTSEGGMARMAVSWDTPGNGGEQGRVRGGRWMARPRRKRFDGWLSHLPGAESGRPKPGETAAAAVRRPRRPRWFPWLSYERVRHGDPPGPHPAGERRLGAQHVGGGGGLPPVRAQRW